MNATDYLTANDFGPSGAQEDSKKPETDKMPVEEQKTGEIDTVNDSKPQTERPSLDFGHEIDALFEKLKADAITEAIAQLRKHDIVSVIKKVKIADKEDNTYKKMLKSGAATAVQNYSRKMTGFPSQEEVKKAKKIASQVTKKYLKQMINNQDKELISTLKVANYTHVSVQEDPILVPVETEKEPLMTIESEIVKVEETDRVQTEIQNVFNYSTTVETAVSRTKYRPQPLPPIDVKTEHQLTQSLRLHANFDLTGKANTERTDIQVTEAISEERPKPTEYQLLQQANQLVLRLHQQKKLRMQKRMAASVAKKDPVTSQMTATLTKHKEELEEQKRSRIIARIQEQTDKRLERTMMNLVSNQLVKVLKIEQTQLKQQKTQTLNKNVKSEYDSSKKVTPNESFFNAPLEAVVPPKQHSKTSRKENKSTTKSATMNFDIQDKKIKEINQTLVAKIDNMEKMIANLKNKNDKNSARLKQLKPMSKQTPSKEAAPKSERENITPIRALSMSKRITRSDPNSLAEESNHFRVQQAIYKDFMSSVKNAMPQVTNIELAQRSARLAVEQNESQWEAPDFFARMANSSTLPPIIRASTDNKTSPSSPATRPLSLLNPWRQQVSQMAV